jgi:predicted metal-dependent enzyme (double-stranded beta helix superfamily)
MSAHADPIAPLREFVVGMTGLVERTRDEPTLLAEGRELLAALIADDAWLPEAFAQPDPATYRQYLLYCDPLERFSVVSFVWEPGHRTPIHDHTVWGLVGVLRGAELCREYAPQGDRIVARGLEHTMTRGMIEAVSPTVGDWHVVANALSDRTSVSIHVYGANIGAVRRHMVDAESGAIRDFVSGYSSALLPNLWDRSAAVRAGAAR